MLKNDGKSLLVKILPGLEAMYELPKCLDPEQFAFKVSASIKTSKDKQEEEEEPVLGQIYISIIRKNIEKTGMSLDDDSMFILKADFNLSLQKIIFTPIPYPKKFKILLPIG